MFRRKYRVEVQQDIGRADYTYYVWRGTKIVAHGYAGTITDAYTYARMLKEEYEDNERAKT